MSTPCSYAGTNLTSSPARDDATIRRMFDGDASTYLVTAWANVIDYGNYWVQVDFPEPCAVVAIQQIQYPTAGNQVDSK